MIQVQEIEYSYGQELEHLDVQMGVKQMASKHVFLQCIWECYGHAAIPYVGMALFDGMITIGCGIWRPRMGVG